MDEAIRDYIRSKRAIQVGEGTAEKIKRELASAWDATPADDEAVEVVGKELSNGLPCPVEITGKEVRVALQPVLTEIIQGIRKVIEDSPPEVTADIYYQGVILTGGGSLLRGLPERLRDELHLHVVLADDPLSAVAVGAGRLLEKPELLKRVAVRKDVRIWEASPELVVNW